MGNLTGLGLNNSRFTMLLMVLLLALGAMSFIAFPKRENPEITIRMAVVSVFYPGMQTEQIEELVAVPLEREIRAMPEVDEIRTVITPDLLTTYVQLEDEYNDLDPIWDDLREAVDDARREMPSDVADVRINTNYSDVTFATVAITGEGFDLSDLREAAEGLEDALYEVEGIASISLYGVQDERVWLEIDPERLAAEGMQLSTLANDLIEQNVVQQSGEIDADGTLIKMAVTGDLESVEAVNDVLTLLPESGTLARLGDFVEVRTGWVDPPQTPVYVDGQPAVIVGLEMASGQDILVVGDRVRAAVQAYEQTLPIGFQAQFITFQPVEVAKAIGGALSNVAQTFVVVLLVIMVALGFRAGIIVSLIVPFSVATAILGLGLFDGALEQISIAAIIIALGLLVDNGVVIVEDITGRMKRGVSAREAALAAGKQYSAPLLISSLTTIFAFTPFMTLNGAAGEFAFSLGAVVASALLGSWVAGLIFLPLITSYAIKAEPLENPDEDPEEALLDKPSVYRSVLEKVLPRAPFVIAGGYVAVAISMTVFGAVPSQMFPQSERQEVLVYMDLPLNASMSQTQARALEISSWISDPEENPGVVSNAVYVGDGGPRFYLALNPADRLVSSAFFLVNLDSYENALAFESRSRQHFFDNHPEGRFKVTRLAMGASESGIVDIRLRGPDLDRLYALGREVEGLFATAPDLSRNENDWGGRSAAIQIDVQQEIARQYGITSEQVSQTLNGYFNGVQVSTFRDGDNPIPIVIRARPEARNSLDRLASIAFGGNGQIVNLEQIANIQGTVVFSRIRRIDGVRTMTVSAKSESLPAADLLAHIQSGLDALDYSGGYSYEVRGEIYDQAESNAELSQRLPLAFALMISVVVLQFNSFRRTAIVFMTVPLVVIGVPFGLMLTGQPMSFFGTLGLISLAGVIINNAIVMIDQIDIERQKRPLRQAVEAAAIKRLRPIILTSITTIVGLLPMYLFGGPLWAPLAVVMIGGLAVASLLTSVFVPAAYVLLFRDGPAVPDAVES